MTETPNPLSAATANAAGIPPPADNGDAMPPKVAKAVNAVMAEVPKLDRSEHNTHGNYNFTSIDGFLEALRPLCAQHGLIISQDEEAFELKQTQNKKGESVTWLVVTYRYTLIHSSGETWACLPTRTIMVNASMGPQSFGAAQSYSLKQYMRSLFQVATCEPEVDSDPKTGFDRERQEDIMAGRAVKLMRGGGAATPPAARAKVFVLIDPFGEEVYQTENVDDYAERLSELLGKVPSSDELKQLWENNAGQVKELPANRIEELTRFYEFRRADFATPPQTALEAG